MHYLAEFCRDYLGVFVDEGDYPDIEYTTDQTELVYVDGEEGDHGKIKIISDLGYHVGDHIIHGGDNEEFEPTEYGKKFFVTQFQTHLLKKIKEIK